MARIFPTELPAERGTHGEAAERETLEKLRALPDEYTVYYSQDWIDLRQDRSFRGEIDFVILREDGALILLEQKSGEIVEEGGRLLARYGVNAKDILKQLHRNQSHLMKRLKEALGPGFAHALAVNSLLYFPNATVEVSRSADIDPALVLHAGSKESLPAFIERNALKHQNCPADAAERLHRFFHAELRIRPSLTRAISRQQHIYRAMTGEVADLLLGFEMHPLRLRIQGTAGCGKTQYGLAVAERFAARGRRVLYLCFNRLLAEELQERVPRGVTAATFHEYHETLLTALGHALPAREKSDPLYWQDLDALIDALEPSEAEVAEHGFDLIVVDEGQDFREDWFLKLKRLLRDQDSGMLWMEDPAQRVQRSRPFELPEGFASWHLRANYRTTREIADYIAENIGMDYASGTGRSGPPVVPLPWTDEEQQARLISEQVRKWREEGVPADQIVVLTVQGKGHSPLMALDSMGGCRLRKATGRFQDGQEIFTDGELLLETARRFKGLEAPCVIVADVDPAMARDHADFQNLLFVAMTRAMIGLAVAYREDRELIAG